MSNSIWKTPDVNPENYQSIMFITKNKSTRAGVFKDGFYYDDANNQYEDDELECWATIYDVKAQADKAERLEEENEAMRDEFEVWHGNYECEVEDKERLQKAVDLALERFDDIRRLNDTYYDKPSIIATETTEEIKQLIKGNQ